MKSFLCISSYFKGEAFLKACKEAGNQVYLITSEKLRDEKWPLDHIDEVFYMREDESGQWNMDHLISAVAYKMRGMHFDRFVALDDFDVEKVAALREQFRIPGMGNTTSRYFRDKLAMRVKAKLEGIPVPEFTPLFNDAEIRAYAERVSPPWMIKPRSEASAAGIKKIYKASELWEKLEELGDERHRFLLEKFSPGQVYHTDALTYKSEVVFSRVSEYIDTPFDVAHGGGIFRSHTLPSGNPAAMVEYASGVNLWAEWARLETAMVNDEPYTVPKDKGHQAGIVVSLSRFEHPDTSEFNDRELVWRMEKPWHIGLIVQSKKRERVLALLSKYTERIRESYHASAPAPDTAI
ncbi:MAG: ATPase [Flavobacteriales bacterium]|nr:ATPase [Flavobacteriales bacterium]